VNCDYDRHLCFPNSFLLPMKHICNEFVYQHFLIELLFYRQKDGCVNGNMYSQIFLESNFNLPSLFKESWYTSFRDFASHPWILWEKIMLLFSAVVPTLWRLLLASDWLPFHEPSLNSAFQVVRITEPATDLKKLYLGTIQILRNQDFDSFGPHPPSL